MVAVQYSAVDGTAAFGAFHTGGLDPAVPCIVFVFSCFVHSSVYAADFAHPAPAVAVLHAHDLGMVPVKVVGDEGYLLVQLAEGVAYNPPIEGRSISNAWRHCGQVAVRCP